MDFGSSCDILASFGYGFRIFSFTPMIAVCTASYRLKIHINIAVTNSRPVNFYTKRANQKAAFETFNESSKYAKTEIDLSTVNVGSVSHTSI